MSFPNIAENYSELALTLDSLLIQHPSSTYFARMDGNAMVRKGILNNAILIVDRSLVPKKGDVVLAKVDDQFLVRIFEIISGNKYLSAANEKYKPIKISMEKEILIWGVVTNSINSYRVHLEL